jgi:integrase/recombinase XerD
MDQPDLRTVRGLRDRAILEVLYSTGIRRMELCRLNLPQVDFVNGLVRVEQGKGRKDRLVPISREALGWIQRYLTKARASLKPAGDEPALFLNLFGRRLSEQLLGGIVRRLVRRANVGKTGSCHLFRHAFATGLLRNGCDLRHIQTMLGHASLETTQLYTHLDTGQIQAAHRQYHPAGRRTNAAGSKVMALLVSDVKELDARDLGRVIEYVGLLKLARLHRRGGTVVAPEPSPCA